MMDPMYYSPQALPPQSYPGMPISATDYASADMLQTQKVQNIISQLNPDNVLEDIEFRLRKMRKDNQQGTWKPINPKDKPVSDDLVSNTISMLSSVLNINTTHSNFNEQEINGIMELIIDNMLQDLSTNANAYGIKNDYTERNRILFIVCGTCSAALRRALKGNESQKFWRSATISGAIDTQEPQRQQPSLKEMLKIW